MVMITKPLTNKDIIDAIFGPVAPIVIEAMEDGAKHRQDIQDHLHFAVKNGFLDEDMVNEMTDEQKENYYFKCQNFDYDDIS